MVEDFVFCWRELISVDKVCMEEWISEHHAGFDGILGIVSFPVQSMICGMLLCLCVYCLMVGRLGRWWCTHTHIGVVVSHSYGSMAWVFSTIVWFPCVLK